MLHREFKIENIPFLWHIFPCFPESSQIIGLEVRIFAPASGSFIAAGMPFE